MFRVYMPAVLHPRSLFAFLCHTAKRPLLLRVFLFLWRMVRPVLVGVSIEGDCVFAQDTVPENVVELAFRLSFGS